MRSFFTIWRRELGATFLSPVAYVTLVVFLGITGTTFVAQVVRSAGGGETLPSLLFGAVLIWLTFLPPVICMRLFAEERRSGTIETLMTAPVTDVAVVGGKFAGALSFQLIVLAPAVAGLFLLVALSPGLTMDRVDIGGLYGGIIIVILLSTSWLALSLVISILTRNQIVAAVASLCAIWVTILFSWLLELIPIVPKRLTEYLSTETHLMDAVRGSLDSRPVILYLTATAFLLFTAVRVLESRRWRAA